MTLFQVTSNIGDYLSKQGNPWEKVQSLNVFIPNIITLALTFAVIAFVIVLLYAGIQWITSGGDKEGLSNAQKKISAAIIGIVILFSTWAIIGLVRHFFGIGALGGTATTPGGTPGSGVISPLEECQTKICWEKGNPCQPGEGWCYKNCRCVCDKDGGMWAYQNPWCDRDGFQYTCLNGSRVRGQSCSN